jgi:putative hemolysin
MPRTALLLPDQFKSMPPQVLQVLTKWCGLDTLGSLYERSVNLPEPKPWSEKALETLQIDYRIHPGDLAKIPREGPAVVVANHPFGLLEGLVLGAMLPRVRPDFRILANDLLATVPELRPYLILVDVFGGPDAMRRNRRGMAEALDWLRKGGLLAVFPAGVVSTWEWKRGVADPAWHDSVARMATKTGAPVVPLYFAGHNSVPFHVMGLLHPLLRTARLPQELLKKRGGSVEVRAGHAIAAKELEAVGTPEQQIEFLRCRTYLLAHRPASAPVKPWAEECAALPSHQKLDESGEFETYFASAGQIPNLLREIGRLREVTFRAAGEGTGNALDLDRFDQHYDHLFVWHRGKQELVGAYRLARTTPVLRQYGIRGLYTSSLFKFQPEFFTRMGPAVELGRSWVRQEYQKEYAPLLMLWRGIARYVAQHPDHPVLFGAVSVSNDYSPAARRLMVEYLRKQGATDPLRSFVKPRNPYRAPILGGAELRQLGQLVDSLDALNTAIEEIEPQGRGVPVLLRQYAKLGGRVLQFHVDAAFAHVLDCLILVDLRQAERGALKRYMGAQALAAFQAHHQSTAANAS